MTVHSSVSEHSERCQILARNQEFVCWSRMQAEAGQTLVAIIARKEEERRAGDGVFFWGVGNPPSTMANVLARMNIPVRVVFSIMKSQPKVADTSPQRTVLWRRYTDACGSERALPPHVLVTSRGETGRGPKTKHFALVCYSDAPLSITRGKPFDPDAYRNASGSGARVGASQVTALLKRTGEPKADTPYEVNLEASLRGGYWVRLSDPVALNVEAIHSIAARSSGDEKWLDFVRRIRDKQTEEGFGEQASLRLF